MAEQLPPTVAVPRPHVPHGPRGVPELLADADYLDHAASNIRGGFAVGGQNVTNTVVKLLHDTATELRRLQPEAAGVPLSECGFDQDYAGKCATASPVGSFCERHEGKTCSIGGCTARAERTCSWAGQFVCGSPLCRHHGADAHHPRG